MKVWLVTGGGNGLGRDIVEAALSTGDGVIVGSRRPAEVQDLVTRFGDRVVPVSLEVRDEAAAQAAVRTAVARFGRLDVLVNNAGYGQFGPFEQTSPEDFKAVVDTCFWGVVYTTRAVLPVMRAQGSGHIFQVSSIGGRLAMPGNSPYHAAKWAVGGFSDSVALEVAGLGIEICTLEPGGILTNWLKRALLDTPPEVLPDYQPVFGPLMDFVRGVEGRQEGDPKKIAALVVELAGKHGLPHRLILGIDAENRVRQAEAQRAKQADEWRVATHSTTFTA